MEKGKRKNNIIAWIKKSLLLGQRNYYCSFCKVFLFLTTHLALLMAVNIIVQLVANMLGFSTTSAFIKVAIPSVISWYLFFVTGNILTEKSISVLVLLYGYIMLLLFAFSNFKAILKNF